MKNTFLLISLFFSMASKAQMPVTDAVTAEAINRGNVLQSTIKSFSQKTFTTITDLKKSGMELLTLTKEYQNALSSVNSVVANSQQTQDIFSGQKQIITLYANNVYKYDRYFPPKYKEMVHRSMKNGLNESFKILKRTNIILQANFVNMNDNERFQQLDKINKDMQELREQMGSFIQIYTRYAIALRENPDVENIQLDQ
ncbi:MAG: hypothetical protein WBP45_15065 [Daejeonella sp.]